MVKKLLLSLSVVSPIATVISCSEELKINDAYKEIPSAISYLQEIKESKSFEKYNEQDMAFYINYLLNHEDADDPIVNNGSNFIEIKLNIPFIKTKEDITEGTVGRVIAIPHGGHNHYIYKTWTQLAPQPWELEQTKTYARFILPVENEKINWSEIQYHNELLRDETSLSSKGELVDLSMGNDDYVIDDLISYWYEEKIPSRELFKDLLLRTLSNSDQSSYFDDIEFDFDTFADRDFITNKNIAKLIIEDDGTTTDNEFRALIDQLIFDFDVWGTSTSYRQTDVLVYSIYYNILKGNDSYLDKVFEGPENLELDWVYNFVKQGVPQSSPALELQYSLLDTMVKQWAKENYLGTTSFDGSNTMFDWWQQARPHVQSQELMIEPEILLNANRSKEDEEIFWNYLRDTGSYWYTKGQVYEYRNPMPSEFDDSEEIDFAYYINQSTNEKVWLMDYASIIQNSTNFFHSVPPLSTSADMFEANEWEWKNSKFDDPISKTLNGVNNEEWLGRQVGGAIESVWSSNLYDETNDHFNWETDTEAVMYGIEFPYINTEQYLESGTRLYYVTNRMVFENKDDADKLIDMLGEQNDNIR